MALDRSQIKVPALPKKTLPCAFLGGEVIVRGLTLAEHLANTVRQQAEREPRPGETEDEAKARTNGLMGLRIAAQAVIDPQGQPLLTLDEWEALSAAHPQQVYDFLAEVSKVALGVEDAEKN